MNQAEKDALRTLMTYFWMSVMLLVGMLFHNVAWLKTLAITIAACSICITIFGVLVFQARARREFNQR